MRYAYVDYGVLNDFTSPAGLFRQGAVAVSALQS